MLYLRNSTKFWGPTQTFLVSYMQMILYPLSHKELQKCSLYPVFFQKTGIEKHDEMYNILT